MGVICAMCQECKHSSTCENPLTVDEARPGKKPCRKYELDLGEEEQKETEGVPSEFSSLPDSNTYLAKESLATKFQRISAKRLTRTLYELKLLGQFGRLRKQYSWTQEQADSIILALRQAVDKVEQQLKN